MRDMQNDPIKVLILGFVTCGIYFFIWLYNTSQGMRENLDDESINPTTEIILTLVTCGLYAIYWNYMMGERIQRLHEKKGKSIDNEGTLYLLLSLFGLSFIAIYMMQDKINKAFEG